MAALERIDTPAPWLHDYGARRALDMLGFWTQASGVRNVHVVTDDPDVLRMTLLRLPRTLAQVTTTLDFIYPALVQPWKVQRGDGSGVDAVLYPFSLEEGARWISAPRVMACARNAVSLQKLVNPRTPGLAVSRFIAGLEQQGWTVEARLGIYPPEYTLRTVWTNLTSHRTNPEYFLRKDRALHTMTTDRAAMSTLVVFHARNAE